MSITKFEASIFIHAKDKDMCQNLEKGSRDTHHALFSGKFFYRAMRVLCANYRKTSVYLMSHSGIVSNRVNIVIVIKLYSPF